MNNLIIRYKIITDRGSGFIPGNFINVYWDDVGHAIVVYKYANDTDTVGAIITSGPDIGALRIDHNIVSGYSNESGGSNYKFCDNTTLNTFVRSSQFPYANRREIANHFSCALAVCDLRITGSETTEATDSTTANGAIHILADTSSPPARYSLLSDFSDGGQLSGDFIGILAGTYTVYAKDARGCSASVTVVVGTPAGYSTKYRLEYYDANSNKTRLDILGLGYSGGIIEVCGGGDPVVIKYNADGDLNKFSPVVPSECNITLLSPSSFYFRELFSQDERKWKVEYSKDFGESIPSYNLIPPLDQWINESEIGGPLWTTGSNPTVTLTNESSSEYLSVLQDVAQGYYIINYNIDVLDRDAILHVHLNSTTIGVEGGHFDLAIPVGNNVGAFHLNAALDSFAILIRVLQDLDDLPVIADWGSRPESSRVPWQTISGEKTLVLDGNVGGQAASQSLYISHNFVEGQTYTIRINILKTVLSGGSGANIYFTGNDDSFFPVYNPFGKGLNAPGNSDNDIDFTFTAPANMTICAIYLYVTGSGRIAFSVTSIEILNSSGNGTTVTVNDISCVVPGIDGPQLQWTGFVISTNYSEPYVHDPYPVTITATDGLADLKQKDFTDRYLNKFTADVVTLDAIAEILNKTDLGLNIITAVNRIESGMTNALADTKFNPKTFYEEDGGDITDCYTALQQIIKVFAVRIFQRNAKWIIMTVEEATHEFAAQEFSASGIFIQNLAIQDITAITGPILAQDAAFTYRDQVLEVVPSYGVMSFEHTLIENPSLVESYSFEDTDVLITPDGVTTFKAWNINISNAPGSNYGIKKTRSFDGNYNFFWEVPPSPAYGTQGKTLIVTSSQGFIEYDANDLIEFRFDYSIITGKITNNPYSAKPHYPFWVRIKWSLMIGGYYFDDVTGEWQTVKKYNDVYVESFNDNQNFKLVLPTRAVSVLTTDIFQVEFVFYDNNVFDFVISGGDYSQLDSIPTVDLNIGYRVRGKVVYTTPRGETIRYMYWQLTDEDSTSDGDNRRRPTDYNDTTNQKVWVLQEDSLVRKVQSRVGSSVLRTESPSPEVPVKFVYMDNVVLRLLPDGTEPPKNITIQRVNNLNIKVDYSDAFLLNDIDIDNINNSERTYKNFFKRLDGTPTQLWQRTYRAGQGKLLELYSADFMSQYKEPGNKITGSMILKNEITFATVLRELFDNKLYMLMGMELHDRQYSIIFDMLELKDVVNDDKSDAIDAGFTSGFTLGFRA